jgi:hypothetical protein
MIDKIALEQTAKHLEETAGLIQRSVKESLELREDITFVLETYFDRLKVYSKDDTLESLTSARDALYQIYLTTGRARQAISLSTAPANKELSEMLDKFLVIIRAQAETHFNASN